MILWWRILKDSGKKLRALNKIISMFKRCMKKTYLISAITVIFLLLFALKPDWFRFLWGWQIFLIPLLEGLFLVFTQNENKTYRFLPKLIIGSFLTSLTFIIFWQVSIGQFSWSSLLTALAFSIACIFGGLIGIVIKGFISLLNIKKKTILIIAIILALFLVFLTTFKIWQKEKTSLNIETTEDLPVVNNAVPVIFPKVEWLSYKNNDLGLTFDYPDKAIPGRYWTDSDNINDVIRSNSVLVKNNILYIKSGECSFDLVEAEYQKNRQEYGDTLDPTWRITVADINNEQELSAFIKKHYGKACTYHKEYTIFQDTFDIVLESDGKTLDISECPVNYYYYLKYSPINKKVASWNTSQECQIGFSFDNCFDKQIAQSFHFIIKEPITYVNSNATVSSEIVPFGFKADDLKYLADECGTKYESGHFDKLVAEFKAASKIIYNFKYKGDSQGDGIFKVTILPNKAGYTSIDQFKKDFDICSAGGDTYPKLINKDWLLFVSSCGSGFDDASGRVLGCDEVRNIVEPSLKLN